MKINRNDLIYFTVIGFVVAAFIWYSFSLYDELERIKISETIPIATPEQEIDFKWKSNYISLVNAETLDEFVNNCEAYEYRLVTTSYYKVICYDDDWSISLPDEAFDALMDDPSWTKIAYDDFSTNPSICEQIIYNFPTYACKNYYPEFPVLKAKLDQIDLIEFVQFVNVNSEKLTDNELSLLRSYVVGDTTQERKVVKIFQKLIVIAMSGEKT